MQNLENSISSIQGTSMRETSVSIGTFQGALRARRQLHPLSTNFIELLQHKLQLSTTQLCSTEYGLSLGDITILSNIVILILTRFRYRMDLVLIEISIYRDISQYRLNIAMYLLAETSCTPQVWSKTRRIGHQNTSLKL